MPKKRHSICLNLGLTICESTSVQCALILGLTFLLVVGVMDWRLQRAPHVVSQNCRIASIGSPFFGSNPMRNLLLFVVLMQSLLCFAADDAGCGRFSNENDKSFCAALRAKDKVMCKKIKDDDDKMHFCSVSISPNSYTCDKIRSDSKRFECLSLVRNTQRKSVWNLTGALSVDTRLNAARA